jgi:phosphoglycerate dehydrogenase-like enzyme
MEIKKLVILHYKEAGTLTESHVQAVKQALPGTEVMVVRSNQVNGAKPLLNEKTDTDVLLTWGFVTEGLEKFCKEAPSLKWIHCFTSGVDGIMASAIGQLDIKISSSKRGAGNAIADHVLAFIFAFTREIPLFMELKRKKVRVWDNNLYKYDEVCYKTIGIVGIGYIGKEIAKKCKLLGMRVLATDLIPDQSGLADSFYPLSEVSTLLRESDFVVLSLPLTEATRNFIGSKELSMMKKKAVLINVAHGEVVDTEALIRALRNKEIAGAGLDVLTGEDNMLQDHPIWELPNVIFTPHIAAMSPHYIDRAIRISIENLVRYRQDEALHFLA